MEASLLTPSNSKTTEHSQLPALPTFMDHIHELRGRLFWIAVIFIIASAAAYPFRDVIINFLVAPLKGQELYYLTPVGGFSFIIKICTYMGAVLTLPVIIFHLYRYLQPAVGHVKKRLVFSYVLFSAFLAFMGLCFAYFISLPAALHFLTGLDLSSVTAMLTVDAYYSFVTTYLIGAALLFQLPLVLLIINSIKPLKPKKLMGYQRHVLLGAFVVAAIISPTPDMTNQALLAAPIIVMYQVGIILIWIRNMSRRTRKKPVLKTAIPVTNTTVQELTPEIKATPDDQLAWIDELIVQNAAITPNVSSPRPRASSPPVPAPIKVIKSMPTRGHAMDFTARSPRNNRQTIPRPLPTVSRQTMPIRTTLVSSVVKARPAGAQINGARYIDGISVAV